MSINMLVFDFRETEKKFFETNKFENYEITFFEESLNKDFLSKIPKNLIDEAFVVSVFIDSEVTEEVICAFKNLRIISTRSTGYDHINLTACQDKNITVLNVKNYGETAVAQYTFGLILALIRNIIPATLFVKGVQKDFQDFTGRDLSNITLGIVGTGAIGSAVFNYSKAFQMKVLAYDISQNQKLMHEENFKYVELDELLANSDIVTLHLPFTGNNYHMFSTPQFEMMKSGSYLVNTSRGELVDINSLAQFIESGKFRGVALDVLACESLNYECSSYAQKMGELSLDCRNDALMLEKFSTMPNVIVTPHIAYDTTDAINLILEKTMNSIKKVIQGDKTDRIV